jgi:hypothetical protein
MTAVVNVVKTELPEDLLEAGYAMLSYMDNNGELQKKDFRTVRVAPLSRGT